MTNCASEVDRVRHALAPANLDPFLTRLRLRRDDHAAVLQHLATLDDQDFTAITAAARAVTARIGRWAPPTEPVFAAWPDLPDRPRGLVPLFGLLAAAPHVQRFHAGRGIGAAQTEAALADLGQQLWVYRQTFGEFGLDNVQWLATVWSGGLFWLGRLQANLLRAGDRHLISVHIPQTGPLLPEQVDASLTCAQEFFAAHFPDVPVSALHCDSWLLDPRLGEVLAADSNIVQFQRRWHLTGERREADAATLYFVFGYRPRPGQPADRTGLPRRTSLHRAVLEHLDAGGHWYSHQGLIQPAPGIKSGGN